MSNSLESPLFSGYDCAVILGDMKLGERIKEARRAAGVTQQELADHCGISMQAVSAWENGQAQNIMADTLFRAADKLRVNPRWLATGEHPAGSSPTAFAEMTSDLSELTVDQQQAVAALVKSLRG